MKKRNKGVEKMEKKEEESIKKADESTGMKENKTLTDIHDNCKIIELLDAERDVPEIVAAIDKLFDLVWYDRHQVAKAKIESGEENVDPEIWRQALETEKKIEKLYSKEDLKVRDDFEWGMINGKLSALRWALGFEWDMSDT